MNLRKWYQKLGLLGIKARASNVSAEVPSKDYFVYSSNLKDLLTLTSITCEDNLESIVEATQKKWLRPQGKERWDILELYSPKEVNKIRLLAEGMGFFQEVLPKEKFYDYALVLGATFSSVQDRFSFLIKLWKMGVRFRELIFLAGERTLDPRIEPASIFLETGKAPKNETEMMQYVYDHWKMPKEMKELPFQIVSVPFDVKKGRRPSTGDTIQAWMDLFPKPGKCLFVSNQPYCLYQDLVVKNYLPKSFLFETVGSPVNSSDTSGSVLLDTIARCLYQELQNRKKI